MNQTFLNVLRIVFALFCIGFGIDKFVTFLPACSLTEYIPLAGMYVTGIIELVLGGTLLFKKYELISLKILTAVSIGGFMFHLVTGSTDFGGALVCSFMGSLLIFAYKKQIQANSIS